MSVKNRIDMLPEELTPEQIGELLDNTYLIETWINAVRSFAFEQMTAGMEIAGYKLVEKRARRKWVNEENAAQALSKELGLSDEDVLTEPRLKSPSQIESIPTSGTPLTKKAIKEVVAKHVISESSGVTMAPNADRREDLRSNALADFSPVSTDDI